MREKVKNYIQSHQLCTPGETITVGLSAGVDSTALFHILCSLREELNIRIQAVHVDHMLRGADAQADAMLAGNMARQAGVPFFLFHCDVAQSAKMGHMGVEEAGRLMRYDALRKAARGGRIAVAHHQDDQAETVLMHLCRGSGMSGLVGMRPRDGDIIRPLLCCRKEEILAYCRENELIWHEDATNYEADCVRNQFRLQVMPLLEEIYPGASQHISSAAEILRQEEDLLSSMAEETLQNIVEQEKSKYCLDVTALEKLPRALRRRVLLLSMAKAMGSKKDLGTKHLEAVEYLLQAESGKHVSLPKGIQARKEYDQLVFEKPVSQREFSYLCPIGEVTRIPEANISVEVLPFLEKNRKKGCRILLDYDKIKDKFIICRSRKPGDRILLKTGHKKIKDILIDAKVPRSLRESMPCFLCGEEVAAIGTRWVSAQFAPQKDTKHYVTIFIQEAAGT